jgi:hypothetical protein
MSAFFEVRACKCYSFTGPYPATAENYVALKKKG